MQGLQIKLVISMNFCWTLKKLDWNNPSENLSKSCTKDKSELKELSLGLIFVVFVFIIKFNSKYILH